ncbi:Nuclear condensin complex subunit 3 C-terminal domain-containing protein [[Candida] zeylanoides]
MSYRPTTKSVKTINSLNGIHMAMAHVFQDAQMTLSGHRKLVIVMKAIQLRAEELGLGESFSLRFTTLVNRILPLKKGEQVGDRIVKFCSVFVATLYKDDEARRAQEDADLDEDTLTDRFVDYLLRHLLRGLQAKDKHVRYRVVQLLAYLLNNIGEIDEELFTALKWSLNRRIHDKEPNVRLQTIVAISRFQYLPQSAGGMKATENIMSAMQNDDSAEVRRAALLNLIKTDDTIPLILERSRDVNSINRRLVYSRISKELGDFRDLDIELREELLRNGLHDRDQSVQSAAIKMLAHNWFETVHEDLLELIDNLRLVDKEGEQVAHTAVRLFYATREDFVAKATITKDAWKELTTELAFFIRTFYEFCNEKQMFDTIDRFYPESIELSQILQKYLKLRKSFITNNEDMVHHYQRLHSELEDLRRHEYELEVGSTDEASSRSKEDIAVLLKDQRSQIAEKLEIFEEPRQNYATYYEQLQELEFIIKQLFSIAKDYDYSDEIGRREMLRITRSTLTNDELSDELIELSLKVLQKISINERDFSTMCTEIVTDIRDSYMDENDETFHSAISNIDDDDDKRDGDGNDDDHDDDEEDSQRATQPSPSRESDTSSHKRRKREPKQPPDDTLIQCLLITQHLLELTEETITNVSLSSLLDGLVRPSVLRNDSVYIRNLAMTCLGLFCLLDRQLAIQQLYLFGVAASRADEELRIISVKVIVDILSTHGTSVLDIEGQVDSLSLAKLFYKLLRLYEMPKLQSVVAEGLCKLFLADILSDFGKSAETQVDSEQEDQEKVLFETLILTYFHPLNAHNQELRQILAFCIPVYSFSHANHQDKVASISGDCFFRLFRENGEFEKYDNMASPTAVLQQLIHWCDPNNLVHMTQVAIKKSTSHLWQAMGLLQALEQDTPRSIKKVIISNLNRLYITEELGSTVLEGLQKAIEDTRLVFETSQHEPSFVLDSLSDRSLDKFYAHISELAAKAAEAEKQEESVPRSVSAPSAGSDEPAESPVQPSGQELNDSLQEIDNLLEKEEEVDYDIDLE